MEEPALDLEAMAAALQESGDYRVLRRLVPRPPVAIPDGVVVRTGLHRAVVPAPEDLWRRD
ncbi:hypothetical protein [Caulobacter rhizosphaerae]|jgi:DNA polymerase-3 subunit epsilon|uniref:hypothetical protein n=1 Tax=Caulobacter rhizosphaerae TaxID=2010972 RepID=UPI001AD7674F|nr:hypothetical protein [Caulobacter rhizosphaerae]